MKLNKVRFYENPEKAQVIAVVYHDGERFEGVATCGPEDTFDLAIGQEIASAKALAARDRARAEEADFWKSAIQAQANGCAGQARTLRAQARERLQTVRAKYSTPAGR